MGVWERECEAEGKRGGAAASPRPRLRAAASRTSRGVVGVCFARLPPPRHHVLAPHPPSQQARARATAWRGRTRLRVRWRQSCGRGPRTSAPRVSRMPPPPQPPNPGLGATATPGQAPWCTGTTHGREVAEAEGRGVRSGRAPLAARGCWRRRGTLHPPPRPPRSRREHAGPHTLAANWEGRHTPGGRKRRARVKNVVKAQTDVFAVSRHRVEQPSLRTTQIADHTTPSSPDHSQQHTHTSHTHTSHTHTLPKQKPCSSHAPSTTAASTPSPRRAASSRWSTRLRPSR